MQLQSEHIAKDGTYVACLCQAYLLTLTGVIFKLMFPNSTGASVRFVTPYRERGEKL